MNNRLTILLIILLNSAFTIQAIESKPQPNEQFSIKFAAYNVLFGLWAAPESIGEKLKKYNPVNGVGSIDEIFNGICSKIEK